MAKHFFFCKIFITGEFCEGYPESFFGIKYIMANYIEHIANTHESIIIIEIINELLIILYC